MAAPYNPPKKGEDFICRVAVEDMSSPGTFRVNPTIAAGDFQVDGDGAGFANLTTLPTVDPAGTAAVKVSLSAAEMTADVVTVKAVDQTTPKEWADFILCIPTTQ